jgi:hypothetical protein
MLRFLAVALLVANAIASAAVRPARMSLLRMCAFLCRDETGRDQVIASDGWLSTLSATSRMCEMVAPFRPAATAAR